MLCERTRDTPFGYRTEYLSDDEVIYTRYFENSRPKAKPHVSLRRFASYFLVFGIGLLAFLAKRG